MCINICMLLNINIVILVYDTDDIIVWNCNLTRVYIGFTRMTEYTIYILRALVKNE